MPDAIVDDPGSVPSIDLVDEEVQAGLKHDQERLDSALVAENYYRGRGLQYLERRPQETDEDFRGRPKRTSKLTRRVTRLLSSQLWGRPPMREVEGSAAITKWYQSTLAAAQADVRLVAADRSATLGHAAAIEVEASGDPRRPVRLWVWKPHEFTVWTREDDPTDVWAVCTRSRIPHGPGRVRCRYRVWTAFERRTYYTKPYGPMEPTAGRRADQFEPAESGPSLYPGVLPFVFVRFESAVSEFWEGGIGEALCELNGEADRSLSDLAQHVQEHLNPIGWARNLQAGSTIRDTPGRFVHLVGDAGYRTGDGGGEPELGYLQASLAAEQAWDELRTYVDQTLEELEVPAATRPSLDGVTDLSGVAIVAKQMPFIEMARTRQPLAGEVETELFAKVCAVVARHHEGQPGAAKLEPAARDPRLVTTWPEPKLPLPTADRDQGDQWELEQGLTDPIEVLARRRGITLAQAEDLAAQMAERRKRWATLMGGVEVVEAENRGKASQAEFGEDDEDDAADGEGDDSIADDDEEF